MAFNIKEELKKLPEQPGVYLMHDAEDRIIYVGKAVNLKNRVRSYFAKTVERGPQILKMISEIDWFETIVVDSETEALVLECNLIKEHRPRYNTQLMDDKTYPYICLTTEEMFPRIVVARRMKRDKNQYFGPYPNGLAVRDTVRLLRNLFSVRDCRRKLPEEQGKQRPCLNYQMHRCGAPCIGAVSREEYMTGIDRARDFLKGDFRPVLSYLEGKMNAASERMEYEEAIRWRDMIKKIHALEEKQKVTDTDGEDRDVLALALEGEEAVAAVFFMRDGRMIGRDHFHLQVAGGDGEPEVLSQFIRQFYGGTPFLPREILACTEPSDRAALEEILSARGGRRMQIRVPQKGEKQRLIELARENARHVLAQEREQVKREEARTAGAQRDLAELLGLSGLERIEAYDISNISGFASVGSMVVYENGRPRKNDYRKFRIRFVEGANDFASLAEVLRRRFSHGLKERGLLRERGLEEEREESSFVRFPDLILMDGGEGQVHYAEAVLREMQLAIPVCGMVKDDRHRTRGLFFREAEVPIDARSAAFRLVTRIQDETHRFAIEFHRSLRSKEQVHSILDDIPGIGPARRKELMRAFRGIDALRSAGTAELAAVPKMNRSAAETVYAFFHDGELEEEETDGSS